ncbi:MAG: hypothetical protein LBP53_08230 [Candidatus Peribacteria bacterium]|jgi:hypothetical protein|nr:hypothetical protein [Candidatus Peribacteria bacterium]
MKKLVLSLSLFLAGTVGISSAVNMAGIAELRTNASFGYTTQDVITVPLITPSSIGIASPILKDIGGDDMTIYKLTYGPYLMEDLVNASETLLKEIQVKTGVVQDGQVHFSLGLSDGLTGDKTYYAMITPLGIYDEPGTSSAQICFNLAQERYEIGNACQNFDKPQEVEHPVATTSTEPLTETAHTAASAPVNMSLANITHTIDGNTISLKWTALEGGGTIDIFVFDFRQEKYILAGTVRMTDEKFDYKMTWDNEHLFRFVPQAGTEFTYTVNAVRGPEPTPPAPVIVKPPVTGPVENMLAVLLLSLLVYGGYRYYTRKSR